jgi:peptidoglycan/xylan/chitin deacetylase (PgdA/CDA1 family)
MASTKKALSVLREVPTPSEEKKIPILMYHSVSEPGRANHQFWPFAVSPALFAEHIKYLHEHGYVSLTVTQLIELLYHNRQSLPEKPVVVTFDDGYADFFANALPVLKRYNFVATLYITTAFVGGRSSWLWREKEGTHPMLTWDQIAEINRQGIECGGHSHTHPQLDLLSLSAARREIIQNKELLEQHLGQKISSFAYPHGYHSTAIQRILKQAGYTSACAVKYEMSVETTSPFSLARLGIMADTDVDDLATLLTSSPPSSLNALYKRSCVPVWRFVRYCSDSTTRLSAMGKARTVAKE